LGGAFGYLFSMTYARTLLTCALLSLLSLGAATALASEKPLTVVELFTSQGCSSCPAADRYLSEMAQGGERDGLLALSFHVDYWDYLGWKDSYSSPVNTQRQHDYARRMDLRYVYTPQMVVQGALQATGSNRAVVADQIEAARSMTRLHVGLKISGGTLSVTLPDAAIPETSPQADVLLVVYDNAHTTAVKRGENRGKTLTSRNVVRAITRIGEWRGKGTTLQAVAPGPKDGDRLAVILQTSGTGPILGAATLALN